MVKAQVEGMMIHSFAVPDIIESLKLAFGLPAKIMRDIEDECASLPKVGGNRESILTLLSKLSALKTTIIAWATYGGQGKEDYCGNHVIVCHHSSKDTQLHGQVDKLFNMESFGVRPAPPLLSEEDQRATDMIKENTKRIGDRYECWENSCFKYCRRSRPKETDIT